MQGSLLVVHLVCWLRSVISLFFETCLVRLLLPRSTTTVVFRVVEIRKVSFFFVGMMVVDYSHIVVAFSTGTFSVWFSRFAKIGHDLVRC
jgi:hypothetical protein